MIPLRRIVLLVLLLLSVLALIIVSHRAGQAPVQPGATTIEVTTLPSSEPSPRSAGSAARPFGTYRKGARTPIPRFTVPAATPDAAAPKLNRPPQLARGNGEGPRNRLPETPPNFQEMQRQAKLRLDQLHEKADRCLAGYTAADPALKKGVMLGIDFDGTGLQRLWIDDLVDIPDGPLRCLSNAAYEIDWSGISDKPLTLTVPERYGRDDAGTP